MAWSHGWFNLTTRLGPRHDQGDEVVPSKDKWASIVDQVEEEDQPTFEATDEKMDKAKDYVTKALTQLIMLMRFKIMA